MSLSTQIDLENLIFARAACLKSSVHSKGGRLVCPSGDLQLQTLIYVYNALLGEENQKRFCMEFEELEPYKNYVAQREGGPGKGTLCKDTEWKFEIILGDKK